MSTKATLRLIVGLGVAALLAKPALDATVVLSALAENFSVMKAAVALGGSVNDREGGALFDAVSSRNYDAVKFLLEAGARVNQRPIIDDREFNNLPLPLAIRTGDENIVRLLIQHGASLNELDDEDSTPLMSAASYGEASICRILIEKGASLKGINKSGDDVLSVAKKFKSRETIAVICAALRPK